MKVIMRVFDVMRLGNEKTWEFLASEGIDTDKPVTVRECIASNAEYTVAFEGEKK